VFDLSLEAMIWSRRSLFLSLFVGFPAAVAILYRVLLHMRAGVDVSPFDLYSWIVAIFWIQSALPLLALFQATALIADEVEGRTMGYLLTRPLTRTAILSGKFMAFLASALTVTLPVVVITFFLLASARGWANVGAYVPDLLRDLGAGMMTIVAYGSLFTFLGVLLRRPVIPGLLLLFGWEMLAHLPGYLPRLTLISWLGSLHSHRPAREGLFGLFVQIQPSGLSLAVLLVSSAAFLTAATWLFSRREYVLEQ
jgi:ABC-type transport system involved in multi-copper enzyme maturation permease subunit